MLHRVLGVCAHAVCARAAGPAQASGCGPAPDGSSTGTGPALLRSPPGSSPTVEGRPAATAPPSSDTGPRSAAIARRVSRKPDHPRPARFHCPTRPLHVSATNSPDAASDAEGVAASATRSPLTDSASPPAVCHGLTDGRVLTVSYPAAQSRATNNRLAGAPQVKSGPSPGPSQEPRPRLGIPDRRHAGRHLTSLVARRQRATRGRRSHGSCRVGSRVPLGALPRRGSEPRRLDVVHCRT